MVKQIANNVIEGLRNQPFALALVVLNVAFLLGFAFMFSEIAQSVERKDALVVDLLRKCGGV
jgi:hypothetical protein